MMYLHLFPATVMKERQLDRLTHLDLKCLLKSPPYLGFSEKVLSTLEMLYISGNQTSLIELLIVCG